MPRRVSTSTCSSPLGISSRMGSTTRLRRVPGRRCPPGRGCPRSAAHLGKTWRRQTRGRHRARSCATRPARAPSLLLRYDLPRALAASVLLLASVVASLTWTRPSHRVLPRTHRRPRRQPHPPLVRRLRRQSHQLLGAAWRPRPTLRQRRRRHHLLEVATVWMTLRSFPPGYRRSAGEPPWVCQTIQLWRAALPRKAAAWLDQR
mmetsp:Transcript_16070/g.40900  ORF Transcript_16070/g.40900 Transcript_16070/m.40900 type:complete len:204 (-) Transcript_16070:53-664(-)